MPVMILLTLVKLKDVGFSSSDKQEVSAIGMWINASHITAMVPREDMYTIVTMKDDRTDTFMVKESPEQIRQMIRKEYKKMVEH